MKEKKQATWGDFAEWISNKDAYPHTQEGWAIKRAAPVLKSKGDARIAFTTSHGYGDERFEELVAEWAADLRSRGIDPPPDLG